MKNVYIIVGHPSQDSFSHKLANEYENKLKQLNINVRRDNLNELNFDPILRSKDHKLEQCLIDAQENIKWANEIIFFYPLWWGNIPALLKGFIDRVFLPNFAYRYHQNDPFWDKLLKGKTAKIFSTCDAPQFYNSLFLDNPDFKFMKKCLLNFCGIKVKLIKRIDSLYKKSDAKRKLIINNIVNKIK